MTVAGGVSKEETGVRAEVTLLRLKSGEPHPNLPSERARSTGGAVP